MKIDALATRNQKPSHVYLFAQTALVFIALAVAQLSLASQSRVGNKPPQDEQAERTSFVLIVADDMGWSDLGALGGEIRTPTLDKLARDGVLFTRFYTSPSCSTTRAMLLSGLDNHLVGVGTMDGLQAPNQLGSPQYSGTLLPSVEIIPEVLHTLGYKTFMTGKWHLGGAAHERPAQRGFDRSFVLLEGGASHFSDRRAIVPEASVTYLEDDAPIELPPDFYSTIGYTDTFLKYLQEIDPDVPFFAYLAYTAPHDPLQVPDEWLSRYKGVYDSGPKSIRQARVERQRALGIFPKDADIWQPPTPPSWLPHFRDPWQIRTEAQRARDARDMELYAAMIELMDNQIQRVIDELSQSGRIENTYIIFLSDNGANASTPLLYPGVDRETFLRDYNHDLEGRGRPGSYRFLGAEWGVAASAPWKFFKGTVGEGGFRSPLIVFGPKVSAGSVENSLTHVTNIAPSILHLANMSFAGENMHQGGESVLGKLLPFLELESAAEGKVLATEFLGNRAIQNRNWKAINMSTPLGNGRWQLYNLRDDPGETNDLANDFPEILSELIAGYQDYANENRVILPDPQPTIGLDSLYAEACNWWCEVRIRVAELLLRLRSYISSRRT